MKKKSSQKINEPIFLINKFRTKLLNEVHLYHNHIRKYLLSNEDLHSIGRLIVIILLLSTPNLVKRIVISSASSPSTVATII